MLSAFFDKFGRPWLKFQRPVPEPEKHPDDSEKPEDTNDQSADKEDVEDQEAQPSLAETEGEGLNLESENSEFPNITAVDREEVVQIEEPSSLGEGMFDTEESPIPAETEVHPTDEEVNIEEIEDTFGSMTSGEPEIKNECLLEDSRDSVDFLEPTMNENTPSMEPTREEAEPSVSAEDKAAEVVQGSYITIEGKEPNTAEQSVEEQAQVEAPETLGTSAAEVVQGSYITTEGKEPNTAEQSVEGQAQVKVPETLGTSTDTTVVETEESVSLKNLEALEAKMETLVAAINTPKVVTESLSLEAPESHLDNVDVAEPVNDLSVQSAFVSREESEEVVVASMTEENEIIESSTLNEVSLTEDKVPVETVFYQNEDEIPTSAPTPDEEEGIVEKAPVVEADIKPVMEDLSTEETAPVTVAVTPIENDSTELDSVQHLVEEVFDDVKSNITESKGKSLESVGHILDTDTQIMAPVEAKPSSLDDAAVQNQIFTVGPTQDLAEANEVLRKYGIQFRRKSNAEEEGMVTVKITRQEKDSHAIVG